MFAKTRTALCAAVALAIGATGLTLPAKADTLRMLTSWDDTYLVVPKVADAFMDMVKKASDGKTSITKIGPEAVPPFEQLQPVSNGVFDLLFTSGAYHSNQIADGMVMDAVQPDPDKRRASGVWDMMDKDYQKIGLKLISLPTLPHGYNILLRKPLGKSCDFSGLKIRGTATYTALIKSLNGSPVVLPPSDIYSALQKGVVDGAAWPVIGALNYGWFEVAHYLLRPAFGTGTYMVLMNLKKWNALPKSEQDMLLAQGKQLEKDAVVVLAKAAEGEQEALEKHGMKVTEMCGPHAKTFEHDWAEGVWKEGIEKGGDQIKALQAAVQKAGINF